MKIVEKKYSEGLVDDHRMVRVFLPDGYNDNNGRYPVVYMNDGQDVFYDSHTFGGVESLRFVQYYQDYGKFLPQIIIVAIEAPAVASERTALYSPYTKNFVVPEEKNFESCIKGRGKEYIQWIIEILKPDIDRTYRTYPDPDFTALCGYSTGGLNSVYASIAFQEYFHRIIAISPAIAIWLDKLQETMNHCSGCDSLKYVYLDVGTNENGRMTTASEFLEGSSTIVRFYESQGLNQDSLKYNVYQNAVHSQSEWRKRFPDALRWIFQDI
ncbi:alpha/beta hydrolase [Sediminispirochaeta smaragdinae]|uniref:Esterase n=1 Tax=Sediminispirochaeta smaragdinae (strain DSM 11293 / JCM 15392 / SEBR 4228) TaxID=573413 RepID=E1R701_SEDSS|nr:alpha/beta hydrolase-fold protein [Sediminispirochaeta smaragdinae]ADK81328.1 putative esterase [Sediminispirochaeta smaragdinae DSM 11293]